MAKKGNSLGGLLILPFLLGAYLYFYYYYITIPITIILAIVIWKRKWIGKQLSNISFKSAKNYIPHYTYSFPNSITNYNSEKNSQSKKSKPKSSTYIKKKFNKKKKSTSTPITSTPITSTPITSTPITSTPITSTPITSTPITSTPITSTPITSTPITSTPITSTPITSTPITSTPITYSHLPALSVIQNSPIMPIGNFTNFPVLPKQNNQNSSYVLSTIKKPKPIKIKKSRGKKIKKRKNVTKIVIKLVPKKTSKKSTITKTTRKSVPKQPTRKSVPKQTTSKVKTNTKVPVVLKDRLNKYSLSMDNAETLLGNDWQFKLSQPDSSLVWDLQVIITKIKSDSKFRYDILPFFENTLKLIEDTYQNVPSIVHSCGINFEDIFVWTTEHEQELTTEYELLQNSSGKFSKYFEEAKLNSTKSKSKSIPLPKKELTLPIALAILGLNSKCDFKQIRSALISKTLQFHPDRNPSPDAPMKMAEINSAYDFLEKNFKGGKK